MIKIFVGLLVLSCVISTLGADSESANEVDPKPPIRLDPALRRALLKAIENLENEDENEDGSTTTEYSTTEESEILATGDETDTRTKVQISVSDQEPAVQYHSFVVDGHKAFENSTEESTTKKDDNESTTYKGLDPILVEDIEVKETSFNTLTQTRSIQSNVVAENNEQQSKIESKNEEKSTKKPEVTTTTTPKPKFNEDGENIEELDNHEVQVFQAPLVAAFTVHQDAQGLPKSVVPIYKQAVRKPITPSLPVTRMHLGSSKFNSQLNDPSLNQFQNSAQQTQISQQLAIHQQLEQKQRLLEEQIQKLQNQQKQQEELLRQQQLLHQQQLLFSQGEQQRQQQQQQQRILEEQKLRQQYIDQQRASQNFIQQNNQFRQPFQKNNPTSVSFQPSISLPPSSLPIGIAEQQLPQREAVDFLVHLRSGQQSQFPLQQTSPIVPSNQLQLPLEKPFTNNFIDKSRQNNNNNVRVFRHDLSTGNFGLNTNNNGFNANNNGFNSNNNGFNRNYQFSNNFRNIPLTPHHNRLSHDNELQSLLLQSGLVPGGRSQEDLSIVSKVLSLNHGLNFRNNFLNQNANIHFGESKRIDVKSKPNFSV